MFGQDKDAAGDKQGDDSVFCESEAFLKLINILKSDENSRGGMSVEQQKEYDNALGELSTDNYNRYLNRCNDFINS